jgi:hypothetical protein
MKRKIKRRVFISYSHKDLKIADIVRQGIPEGYEVWMDREQIQVGMSISESIKDGLSGSDYMILIISENSSASNWVKREIAMSFELAKDKKLSIVPIILQGSNVPLEFSGLMYLDFRKSLDAGMKGLKDFFLSQVSLIKDLEPRRLILKSSSDEVNIRLVCTEELQKLALGDLRFRIAQRLSFDEVAVLWFDIFDRRMSDEVRVESVATSCVEIIDRSRRRGVIATLLNVLCRNYPFVSSDL